MNNFFNENACFLKTVTQPDKFTLVSIESILKDIQSEKYKPLIDALPDSKTHPNEYTAAKKLLPVWALNGTFSKSVLSKNFTKSSGFFLVDIDGLEDTDTTATKIVCEIPHIFSLWVSPSGHGLKVLLRIDGDLIKNDADFKKAYAQIEAYFLTLDIEIDTNCKDVRRLCFVSSDPDIFINQDAVAYPFDMVLWNQSDKPKHTQPPPQQTNSGNNQDKFINRACDIIRNSQSGERHNARLKAGKLAGGQIAAGLVNESAVTNALFSASDAISTACGDDQTTINNAHKAILDGIAKGKLSPVDEDRPQQHNRNTNSGEEQQSGSHAHNNILDNEQHHCTVDLLQYVDKTHLMRQLALSIAKATHLPVNTVFLVGLAVFSSVACRRWRVEYQHGGYLPIGLYLVAEQPSGAAKSWATNTFQKPFYEVEKEAKQKARARLNELKLNEPKSPEDLKEIESLENVLRSVLFTTNSTPEALEQSLTHSKGFFSAVSSEQGLFNAMLGACYGDGKTSNNDLLLNGSDGGHMSSKRVGRDGYTGNVAGAAVMFAQSGGIENLLKASNGTGLAERFLLIAEQHNLGRRDHTQTAIINHDLIEQYAAVCTAFAGDILSNPIEYEQLPSLKISANGWRLIAEHRNSIEHHLADGGRYSHIAIRGAAAKEDIRIMKSSAVLSLLDAPENEVIEDKHVIAAIGIAGAMLEANLKLCTDKDIVGVNAAYKSILSLFEKSPNPRTERIIIQSKSQTAPFKEHTGNKSEYIKNTLAAMVNDGVLQLREYPSENIKKYSLAQ